MPMPPGTYLRSKANEKNAVAAKDAKQTVATAQAAERAAFLQQLERLSESRLKGWLDQMKELAKALEKKEPLAKDDKRRKAMSEAVGEVAKVLKSAKDLKAIEATLQQPATAVLRAPSAGASGGAELALVIALCKVLQILLLVRRRKA